MACEVEKINTGDRWIVSRSVVIEAPAQVIFDILADPRQHAAFDGSGTVQGAISGPQRLALGESFRMDMKIKVPYRIGNTVKEFEEGRRIAWAHMGGHRWRYELTPLEGGHTRVTETFDATTARSTLLLKAMRADAVNAKAIDATLCRLKDYVESRQKNQP
jgi:uncharacterized protein YndB with AHSA1/START domain